MHAHTNGPCIPQCCGKVAVVLYSDCPLNLHIHCMHIRNMYMYITHYIARSVCSRNEEGNPNPDIQKHACIYSASWVL